MPCLLMILQWCGDTNTGSGFGEKEALIKCRGVLIIKMISPTDPVDYGNHLLYFIRNVRHIWADMAGGGAFNILARRAHRMVYRTIGTVCCVIMLMIFE